MQTKTLKYLTVQVPDTTFILSNDQISLLSKHVDMLVLRYDGAVYLMLWLDLATYLMRARIYTGRKELNHHIQCDPYQTINIEELDQLLHWSPPIDCRLEELTNKLEHLRNTDTEADSNTETDVS